MIKNSEKITDIESAGGKKYITEVSPDAAQDFLKDESSLHGHAEKVFTPSSESELNKVIAQARTSRIPLTVSSGRTGITGGAVPQGGWVVSLVNMNRFLGLAYDKEKDCFRLRCQSGLTLEKLNEAIHKKSFPGSESWAEDDRVALKKLSDGKDYIFPVDPTEPSATIGGMASCNASGARTLHYGAMRHYVSALRICFMNGSCFTLKRGQCYANKERKFRLAVSNKVVFEGKLPEYEMPEIKNAAGLFSRPDMDMVDLFVGSEGTLGVFSEVEIVLVPTPELIMGTVSFFPSEQKALSFIRAVRGEDVPGIDKLQSEQKPFALELFDSRSLALLMEQKKKQGQSSTIPALPERANTAVYIEFGINESELEDIAEAQMALMQTCGSAPDAAWTAFTPEEMERLKEFRHAVPEAVNQLIASRAQKYPGLTKLGTDFAVKDSDLLKLIELYHTSLDDSGLEYVMFGHIGNNHLHVNILPKDLAEYEKGKAIYLQLAKKIVEWHGTVSGEHGIGKLKKQLLAIMVGEDVLQQMRVVKQVFDPHMLLNKGNMF